METTQHVRVLLLVAGLAVVVEQTLLNYSQPGLGPHLFWGAISMFLLWRISRHGSASRYLFLIDAAIGVALYVLPFVFLTRYDARAALLVVAYGVQAAIMFTPAIAAWTAEGGPASRTA